LSHDCGGQLEQLHLVFRVVSTSVSNILQGNGGIHTEAFRNGLEFVGPESSFSVNVNGLSFGTSVRDCHLASDAEGVAELRLSGTELSKDFRDGSSLDSSFQELVKLDGSRGESDERPVFVCKTSVRGTSNLYIV
jgi:hypothetical protein